MTSQEPEAQQPPSPSNISNPSNSDPPPQPQLGVPVGQGKPFPQGLSPQIISQVIAQMLAQGQPGQAQLRAGMAFVPVTQQTQSLTWQAPFPPPEAVERYEKVCPGSFDRIVKMAERMEAAQISQSDKALSGQISDVKRGHWLGWTTGIAALTCALILGIADHDWLGAAFLALPVMGLAKSFIDLIRGEGKETVRPTEQAPEKETKKETKKESPPSA